jgi:hypothetical protein
VETADIILKVPELGWGLLGKIKASSHSQTLLKERLIAYGRNGFLGYEDEASWVACIIALSALDVGNFGIGALIVDDAHRVLAHGYNKICSPTFRSDAHAEMVALSNFEERFPNQKKRRFDLVYFVGALPNVLYAHTDLGHPKGRFCS